MDDLKDKFNNAYIERLAGIAEYKNEQETYIDWGRYSHKKGTTIEFVDNTPGGVVKIRGYYPNGKLAYINCFKNFQYQGNHIHYSCIRDGISSESCFINGLKISSILYNANSGSIRHKEYYENGELVKKIEYNEDGTVKTEINYGKK